MNCSPTLQDVLRNTPESKLAWQVSSSDICYIAQILQNWQLLAPHLISPEQEEAIIRDHPRDFNLQKLKFLQLWSRENGEAASYGELVRAIFEVKNLELIDTICQLLHEKSHPSPPYDRTLHDYTCVLRQSYIRLGLPNIFETLTGDDEEAPSPSDCYINLVLTTRKRDPVGPPDKTHMALALHGSTSGMVNYMKEKEEKVPVDIKDIFSIEHNSSKFILLEGAPGSGKTTVLRYITQKWACGELFQQYTLVVLVQLRDIRVQEAKSIADILPFEYEKNQKINSILSKKQYKGLLLLLDGWDELPIEMQTRSLFLNFLKIPQKYSLLEASVVVSSRPIASASLQMLATTRLEILGFTPEQIFMYVTKSLPEEKAEDLSLAIRTDPLLLGNCYLPLNLAIITHTYKCMGHDLPETYCRIIMELALSCVYRHIKKHTPYGYLYVTLNSFDDLQDQDKNHFEMLCKDAYISMFDTKTILVNKGSAIPTFGLLQSIQSFIVRGKRTQHYFLHLSLHELCAAWYLLRLEPNKSIAILRDFLQGDYTSATKEGVLKFFSALGGWDSKETKQLFDQHAHKVIVSDFDRDWHDYFVECFDKRTFYETMTYQSDITLFIQYIYEAHNAELCESLPSVLRIFPSFPLFRNDIIALRFLLSNKKMDKLLIQNDCFSAEYLKVIEPALKRNAPRELHIAYSCECFGDEGVRVLADVIKEAPVEKLYCVTVGMTQVGAEYLGRVLHLSRLTTLCVSDNPIGDTGSKYLTHFLKNTALTYFGFANCKVGESGLITFSHALPKTKIIKISIGGNDISSKALYALADAIMKIPNFGEVDFVCLSGHFLQGTVVQNFLKLLLHHPNSFLVKVNDCTFDDNLQQFYISFNILRIRLGLHMVLIIPIEKQRV